MTKREYARVRPLVERLLKISRDGSAAREIALELKEVIKAPGTLGEIILTLDAENHKERARLIGISRQGYYNLVQGMTRPNLLTVKRLADLTGFGEDEIRRAGP